jgi:hypothetical protein
MAISQIGTNGIANGAVVSADIATGAVALATQVSGTLPVANGGTGLTAGGPAFSAYLAGSQTLSSATITKITFDAELWDTNSNFASSRFTPTVAGYYQINSLLNVGVTATRVYLAIYKNGSLFQVGPDSGTSNIYSAGISSIVYCNGTSDYIEIYGQFTIGQSVSSGSFYTWFNGCLLRTA